MGEYLHHAEWYMVFLYYLPLALVLSLMMFLVGGDPGYYYWPAAHAGPGNDARAGDRRVVPFSYPCVLCWGGYRIFVPRRQQVSHGNVD
jgi:hypothetical protein